MPYLITLPTYIPAQGIAEPNPILTLCRTTPYLNALSKSNLKSKHFRTKTYPCTLLNYTVSY